MPPLMRHPIVIALLAGAAVLAAALLLPLWQMLSGAPPAAEGRPWQLQRQGDVVRGFGLQLPGSTLADARRQWGDSLQVAVMAERGASGALEGHVERIDAGGVVGRLLLATALPADAVQRLQEGAAKIEPVAADTRRYALGAAALAALATTPVVGITFVPAAQIDAAILLQRFGEPAERLRSDARLEHWLYPALGLAIVLDTQGQEVIQLVAPADFEARLRAPLIRAGASPAAGPTR